MHEKNLEPLYQPETNGVVPLETMARGSVRVLRILYSPCIIHQYNLYESLMPYYYYYHYLFIYFFFLFANHSKPSATPSHPPCHRRGRKRVCSRLDVNRSRGLVPVIYLLSDRPPTFELKLLKRCNTSHGWQRLRIKHSDEEQKGPLT